MKMKTPLAFKFAKFTWLVCVLGNLAGINHVHGQGTMPDVGVRFQPPKAVLLTNATIVVAPGRKLENADLLIRDGKIAKVGVDLQPLPMWKPSIATANSCTRPLSMHSSSFRPLPIRHKPRHGIATSSLNASLPNN